MIMFSMCWSTVFNLIVYPSHTLRDVITYNFSSVRTFGWGFESCRSIFESLLLPEVAAHIRDACLRAFTVQSGAQKFPFPVRSNYVFCPFLLFVLPLLPHSFDATQQNTRARCESTRTTQITGTEMRTHHTCTCGQSTELHTHSSVFRFPIARRTHRTLF